MTTSHPCRCREALNGATAAGCSSSSPWRAHRPACRGNLLHHTVAVHTAPAADPTALERARQAPASRGRWGGEISTRPRKPELGSWEELDKPPDGRRGCRAETSTEGRDALPALRWRFNTAPDARPEALSRFSGPGAGELQRPEGSLRCCRAPDSSGSVGQIRGSVGQSQPNDDGGGDLDGRRRRVIPTFTERDVPRTRHGPRPAPGRHVAAGAVGPPRPGWAWLGCGGLDELPGLVSL